MDSDSSGTEEHDCTDYNTRVTSQAKVKKRVPKSSTVTHLEVFRFLTDKSLALISAFPTILIA